MITLQLKSFGLVIYFFMFLEDTFFKVFYFFLLELIWYKNIVP